MSKARIATNITINNITISDYWSELDRCFVWKIIFCSLHCSGFPKFVSLNAKASKTLFEPIIFTNPSVLMTYNGKSSFKKSDCQCAINRMSGKNEEPKKCIFLGFFFNLSLPLCVCCSGTANNKLPFIFWGGQGLGGGGGNFFMYHTSKHL